MSSDPSKPNDARKPRKLLPSNPNEPWLGTRYSDDDSDFDSDDERNWNDYTKNGPYTVKVCCCDARFTKALVGTGNVRFRKGCICYDNKDEDYVPDMLNLCSCCSGKDSKDEEDEGSLPVKRGRDSCSDEKDTKPLPVKTPKTIR